MKVFETRQIMEAYEHARLGGQSLHLHSFTSGHPLFERYKVIAHLLDNDVERLKKTARKLGVRVIKVEHPGTHRQHIDLCGKPLERALLKAREEAE